MIDLRQGDCLELLKDIPDGSVDLILTDPPYGTVKGAPKNWTVNNDKAHEWDSTIEPNIVFASANRILRKNGKLILFSQEPYSSSLIMQAAPNIPFNYRMIWEKDSFANALLCNKAPVGFMEDILVFGKSYDLKYVTPNNPMFKYFKDCKKNSGLTTTEFNQLYCRYVGKTKNTHRGMTARCWETSQFWFPNKDIYENVLQPTGYFPEKWEYLKKKNDEFHSRYQSTFNLWQGNKFKSNILKYKKDYSGYHPTQKPVLLLEDLIKTYSNEGNTVLDFTMGSGSTGVACVNTNRRFIGIELDPEYFAIAEERINQAAENSGFFNTYDLAGIASHV